MKAPPADEVRLIVGVGASAGGLTALKQLVHGLPTDAGLALVVIQHLDPDHKSMLGELLDRHSPLPVLEARDGQRIVADTIYIIPPDRYLSIRNGVLQVVEPTAKRGLRKAIDYFFESLAAECGRRCAAVLLSGTGSDGTAGCRAVREVGGLTIAQDPATAEHASMPTSAIAATVIDAVVGVGEIPAMLEHYVDADYERDGFLADAVPPLKDDSLADLAAVLREQDDFNLDQYKPRTVQRRVARRMKLAEITDYGQYLERIRSSEEERRLLTQDLMITVTDFFRDPESFRVLERDVIPRLLSGIEEDRDIRVWVPGCATGEEAYSIAMVFLEAFAESKRALGIRIFATDIDANAIDVARRGAYPQSIAERVPQQFLDKYFTGGTEGAPYRIATAVRELISFAVQDVVADPPFNHLDLISCRNLLIYLRRESQEKVLRSFYFALESDSPSFLFLGSSETAGFVTDLFEPAARKSRLYRKIPGKDKRGEVLGSISPTRSKPTLRATRPVKRPARTARQSSAGIERALVEAFVPPGVVVDSDGRILHNHGDWRAFMAIPAGEPRNEIARLVLPALRSRIRTAIYKVQKSKAAASFTCFLPGEEGAERRQVRVDVAPLRTTATDASAQFGIVFRELGAAVPDADSTVGTNDVRHANQSLEQELSETREELQNTIEELETSTEELKASNEEAISANEELQSANEELEASAEELRSLNDELTIVNTQLKTKIQELQAANNDVENFFSSTNIPTVFLNLELAIERYTPAAAVLLDLEPRDVGRPLKSAGGGLVGAELEEECQRVLADLQPVRREVAGAGDRWFIRQVTPYRTEDRRIDGVVIAFQDVTDLKRLGERAESRERQQSVVAQLGLLSLAGEDADGLIEHAVRQTAEVLGADLCKVLRYRPESDDLQVVAGVGLEAGIVGEATVAANKQSQAGYTLLSQQPVIVDRLADEKRFTGANLLFSHQAVSGMSCVIRHSGTPYGVLAVHTRTYRRFTQDDANFLVSIANLLSTTLRAQETTAKLQASEEQFRTMANSIPQLAWITDETGAIVWYNQQWFDYTGTTLDQVNGWGWRDVHHPDHIDRVVAKFREFVANGTHWEDTFPLRSRTGEYRWFLSRAQPIRDASGEIVRWFGTNTDITEQRENEKALRASEEKLRLAINTNSIGTFEYRPVEDTVSWDKMLDRVWGIAGHERATMTAFWEGLHPDDAAATRAALEAATLPEGDGYYHTIYRVINRLSGDLSWIEASGQTLFEDGKPVRMIGLVIDITERKVLEDSLTRAINELRETDERKNEFLAVLGHELRNPLAALNNSVDVLGLMPSAVSDVLDIMRNSVRTMSRLLDDLLDLNRITQDKIQLELQVVDIAATIRKSIDYTAAEFEKRHQVLKSTLDDDLFVRGDMTRLEQIFSNLLTNASKYTPHGGCIEIRAEQEGNDIVVTVSDTGIGVDAGDIERIFDPFFQVRSGGTATSGLGIGLALSRKLAELHDGTVSASSEGVDRGTSFVVRVPAYLGATAADDPERTGAWPALPPSLAIVLIDDNEDILKTLPGLLESLQCNVVTARTGEYGLQLARSTQPDAVLIDIGLPDMSGHDVARSLRADGFEGLLVAISGYGHREARERSSDVGFDHHLAKPAKLKDIASVLAQARGN